MVWGGGGDAYKFYTPFPRPKNVKRLSQGLFSQWHVPRAPILYLRFQRALAMHKQKVF